MAGIGHSDFKQKAAEAGLKWERQSYMQKMQQNSLKS